MGDPPLDPPAPVRRRGVRILLRYVAVALVVVAAGLFFARRQIGDRLGRSLDEWLTAAGVFVSWQSADWLPGVGVRLHGLALYRDAAKHDRVALFGTVTAIKGDEAWHRWEKLNFKTADTQAVLGSGADETKLEHLDMLLLIQPGTTELRACHASLQGLRVEVNGKFLQVAPAGEARPDAATKQPAQNKGLFSDVSLDWLKPLKEWMKFQPGKDEPVLRVELHSLPQGPGLELAMTFDGTSFQWRGEKWDFMQAAMKTSLAGKKLPIEIAHWRIGHAGRKAEIAGTFNPDSGVVRISRLDSGIELLALARALVPDAVGSSSAAKTTGAWRISGSGEIRVEHPENCRWQGEMALDGEFLYANGGMKIALQKPAFAIRVAEQEVTVSDLKAGLWGGSLEAKRTVVHLPSAKNNLRIETQAVLDGGQFALIRDSFNGEAKPPRAVPLSWKGAWRISGAGEIPKNHPENWRWNGEAALGGEIVYASGETKIALQKPAFGIRVAGQDVTISDFKAGLWDGSLLASKTLVHLPSAKKNLRFETQATLNGARLPPIIDSFNGVRRNQPGSVPFSWTGAWRISGGGEIPMKQPENWRWNGDAVLDGDVVYTSSGTKIAAQKPAFTVRWEQQDVTISDFKARLWDGTLDASRTLLHLPSPKTKLRFETEATLRDARLQSAVASFGAVRKDPGTVQCDWKGGGEFEVASLTGSGALSIGDTGFAHIPLLGGMHVLFEKLTPRFRSDVESTMTVKHRMAGGALQLEDLKLDSKQAHIEANGAIDLVRDHAQITAQGRLRGITGLATVILASLLEFEGEGPVRDMHWKLKNIPGVGLIGNTAKKITGKEKGAVKGTDEGVKGAHGSDANQPPGR